MKLTKMMVIAAFAALAVMAVAASSAFAEAKVCSTSGTGPECLSGHGREYTGKIVATLTSGTSAVLSPTGGGASGNVKCASSTTEGELTNSPSTGHGIITKQTFGTCTSETVCAGATTASTNASAASPWTATATTTTKGVIDTNGRLDVTGTDITGTVSCLGFPICTYKATSPTFDITGSDVANGAILHTENIVLTKTSGSEGTCGTDAKWEATYTVTTPATLMIE